MYTNNKKNIFNKKIQSLIDSSNEKSYFIDNALYNTLLVEVKKAKILLKDKQGLTSKCYRRMKRYDILTIRDTNKFNGVNSGKDTNIYYYVKNDELFDIIEAAHINTGHKSYGS